MKSERLVLETRWKCQFKVNTFNILPIHFKGFLCVKHCVINISLKSPITSLEILRVTEIQNLLIFNFRSKVKPLDT